MMTKIPISEIFYMLLVGGQIGTTVVESHGTFTCKVEHVSLP